MTWICAALSDADRAAARRQDAAPREHGGVPVRMLDIAPEIFDQAYNDVANSTLWFVHHMLFDTPTQPQFGLEFRRDWESYLAYNEAFADGAGPGGAAGREDSGGRALVQDYHLSLAPRLLRERLAPAPTSDRALLAHAVGAARLLPDAARARSAARS